MWYFALKALHVMVAAIVLALALSSSLRLVYGYKRLALANFLLVVKAHLRCALLWVLPGLLLQMVLGFSIAATRAYSLHDAWLLGVFVGYVLLVLLWLVACLQLWRFYLQPSVKKTYCYWLYSSWGCLVVLLVMIFLMANRPGY